MHNSTRKYKMKICFIGNGNAQATKIYNTCFFLSNNNEGMLVDAGGGNGILSLLEKNKISLQDINHLFVTHAHIDHLLGVFWIIRRIAEEINKENYQGNLTIHAHKELIDLIILFTKATLTKKITSLFGVRIIFEENKDKESFSALGGSFMPFDIHSRKLKQFGFVFSWEGKTFVNAGDEPLARDNLYLAHNAYALTLEAFCLYEDRDRFHPYEKNHTTVKDGAILAEKEGVKNLFLYHTEDKSDISSRVSRYLEEAKKYYHGNVFVPYDGETFIL